MMERKKSYVAYFLLVLILCLSAFLFDVLDFYLDGMDHSFYLTGMQRFLGIRISNYTLGLINAAWRLIAYGVMGLLGLYLSFKTGFKDILNDEIKRPRNIIITVIAGVVMGLYFVGYEIMSDNIFRIYLLKFCCSNLPSSIFASIAEGIGCQILNMLRVAFLMWLFSKIIKTEENRTVLFLGVAIVCALIFAIEHVPTTMDFNTIHYSSIFSVPSEDLMVMIGLYAPLSLVCTYFLKKFGLLSAITVHFICDLIWRVLWPWNTSW